MTKKVFRAIMTAALCVAVVCGAVFAGFLYPYFAETQREQLWNGLSLAASGVEKAGTAYLETVAAGDTRLTWIRPDGTVVYDTQADPAVMDSHADREEVQQALKTGRGTTVRYSGTLLEKTVYCATRLTDGSVLRISVSTETVGMLVVRMLWPLCGGLLLVLLLAILLARQLSKGIVAPLNALDLEHPLENCTYDEIAPLLRRISQQRSQIDTQLLQLQQRADEWEQITGCMNEGLVLLNEQGKILSINPAAQRLFQTDLQSVGQDLLTVERSVQLSTALTAAAQAGHGEGMLERGSSRYQVDISRIDSQGVTLGTVLLIFDVTEKAAAEQSRREFTANVSHELKTPLTAILGSSEMLESGMVKPEDMPRFAGHIHQEAARLLTLIEDIIRLSQLDEGVSVPMQTVDLSAIAGETVSQLQAQAEKCRVALLLQTEPCRLQGVPRLFQEIVYNLTENAIKYNVPEGSVTVCVSGDGVLTVADTGIGIPPEHQERVFERFYRVDKSHSRQHGGTGLGLSIVKHAASELGATVTLQSQPHQGTTITVRFQAKPLP